MGKKHPIKIYHNPRCGKSRAALKMLKDANCEIEVKEYLQHPPDREELKMLLKKLGLSPHELIRTQESIYKENYKDKKLTDDEWVDVLLKYPILIERPIVVFGSKAWIVRTEEAMNEIKQLINNV